MSLTILRNGQIVQAEPEWVAAREADAIADAVVTPAMLQEEARRRILARYPDWMQQNMTARGVELQDMWRRNGSWTMEEEAEATALQAAWDWIKAVRAASNAMEANPPADFRNDAHWPAL